MTTIAMVSSGSISAVSPVLKRSRIESIDLLRGIVMIIMALDHVRDYFHDKAFLYSPEDLSKTTVAIFFTRWITHFCAPVFVLLAGISANLYGEKKGKEALSFFLFTRGLWLVIAELFIVTLGWTFNPSYPFFNLQVIWATGISMIALAAIIYMDRWLIFITGIVLIAGHNLLDTIHVPGNGLVSFFWSLLHEPGDYTFGHIAFSVRYPVLPWIGIMAVGYCAGQLYTTGYDAGKRKKILLFSGFASILFFIILRAGNFYGDVAHWSLQKNTAFSVLSFLNVSKYPPSLLYILITLGPALIFLSLAEKPLNASVSKITVLGRVPMFYYLLHIFLIHFLAAIGAVITGYHWSAMILSVRVNHSPQLKGYGFDLGTVYMIWAAVVLLLCPLCTRFDRYKRTNQSSKWWLGYL
jgi:uncharacterized membrane protein